MSYRILLVDDEPDIVEIIEYNLSKEGYEVATAQNGVEGYQKAIEFEPHLIILDVMMPEMDGFETCKKIRSNPSLSDTIITFLSARGEEHSQMEGFDMGADDYIAKPIRMNLLKSRVKALLKRIPEQSQADELGLEIDRERYLVKYKGEEIVFPRKEFELLALLHSKPDKVFTRDEIFATVWGSEVIVGGRTIDVHIRKIREKLNDELISTIKGVGYKLTL
ncbi:MAG: response regulator transcription factor [Rikenellaceae bacterium]